MSINNIAIRPLSWVKNRLVKTGRYPYKVPLGLFKGLTLNLDLRHQTQVYLGLWEQETYASIRKATKNCAWMIDIGAGKGELCVYFLKHSDAQQIFAFEPQAGEISIMKHNLELNQEIDSNRMIILDKFVGTESNNHYQKLDELGIDRSQTGFIKIDVDGYELDVLKSSEALFKEANVRLLLETHSIELEQDCTQWLEQQGYQYDIIYNAWWRMIVPERRPVAHNRWLYATKVS